MPPTSLKVLSGFGLIGTPGGVGSLVPRADTPDAGMRQYQEFIDAGRVADPNIWSRYSSTMKRPTSFESMLQFWNEMADWDLMTAALSEIVHEATQTDANSPGMLWYECNDRDFEDELNDMLATVGAEDFIPSQVWHVAGLGNHFEKLDYRQGEGVLGMSFIHPLDCRRYWLEKNRKCVGFRWQGHKPEQKEHAYVGPDGSTQMQRVSLAAGQDTEDLWYPWDIMHIRRMFRLRISEHGEPIFDEASGIYKKLRLAIDQMVVHRAQIQPDRYSVNIDVKDQAPMEQMRTVQRWKQTLRSKLSFGQGGGSGLSDPDGFDAFYNAMSLDTVLYVARPSGFNHSIDRLQGTARIPDVYDIELLIDLFYSIIGMPRSWFGATKDGEEAPSGKALLAQDMRFLRKIRSIRNPIISAYQWLGYFHAVLKGKDPNDLEIEAKMSPIGSLEDQMKLELLELQANVLDRLGDVMDKFQLPREAWVEIIFKRYMHLPDDVVNVFLTALPPEVEQQVPESATRRPAPRVYRLIREIEESIEGDPETRKQFQDLRNMVGTGRCWPRKRSPYRNVESVMGYYWRAHSEKTANKRGAVIQESDLVVGSNSDSTPFKTSAQAKKVLDGKTAVHAKMPEHQPLQEGKRPDYLKKFSPVAR